MLEHFNTAPPPWAFAPVNVVALTFAIIGFALIALMTGLYLVLRKRGIDRWLLPYLATRIGTRSRNAAWPIHVLFCIADHYEPRHGKVADEQAKARVSRWVDQYPGLGRFRDSDGRPPRHSYFFPIDEYEPTHVDALVQLCAAGFGEIEIQLHHDNDTAEGLREKLSTFVRLFHERHGLLARDKRTGAIKYGFVHGNWALDNSRPDGRWCGVNNELDVLRETGCYADFTMPSAPSASRTQTRKVNGIYYAVDDPLRPRSHDWGVDVGSGPAPQDALMLIQGPLMLNWRRESGRRRLLPGIENGNIQGNQPPTMARLDLWLRARVRVRSRPDWYFVKLHTHGATEQNAAVLLGEPMVRFHEGMARRAAEDGNFQYHYVTAREMYNLVKAAEAGWSGSVADARDFELEWRGAMAGVV
jgi:hypothetical protein